MLKISRLFKSVGLRHTDNFVDSLHRPGHHPFSSFQQYHSSRLQIFNICTLGSSLDNADVIFLLSNKLCEK